MRSQPYAKPRATNVTGKLEAPVESSGGGSSVMFLGQLREFMRPAWPVASEVASNGVLRALRPLSRA